MSASSLGTIAVRADQPFPGLRPFDLKDAFLFFGRERATQELLDRLSFNRFLAVVGTSGSGKSSLVRAGLMSALFRGYLVGATSRWRIAVMRPGSAPLAELAGALSKSEALDRDRAELTKVLGYSSLGLVSAVRAANLLPGESLLLVVDQFEEIFRFASERRVANGDGDVLLFVRSLLEAVDQREVPIYVVLTMRTDFLGDCTAFPGLPEALNRNQYLIPRLTRDERRAAIEQPLEIAGAEIAPRLTQQILNDMGDDPDQLPVMQHALSQLYREWSRHPAKPLDLDDYTDNGTNAGALAVALDNHPQSIYDGFSPADRGWTRRVFRCLTTIENGREVRRPREVGRITRIVGAVNEIDREAVRRIVGQFARPEHSLLLITPGTTSDQDIVDISHESLIRKWRQLKQWAGEEAESADWLRELFRDTERQARGQADYWTNPELTTVLARKNRDGWTAAWAEQYEEPGAPAYSDVEAFLDGSRVKERARRRNRLLQYAGIALLVVTAGAAAFQTYRATAAQARARAAEDQVRTAEAQARMAEAQFSLKLKSLELQLLQTTSPLERERIQNDIDTLQLQRENFSLKTQITLLTKQAQQATDGQGLAQVVGAQQATLDAALSKAEAYDTLQKRFGDPAARLAQLEQVEKERNDLRVERDRLKLTTASAERPPVTQSATSEVMSVEVAKNSAARVANVGLTFFADWDLLGANVYILSGSAPITEPFLKDSKKSASLNARLKAGLKTCDGGNREVYGATVWCVRFNNRIFDTRHDAGQVTAENRTYEVFPVAFDDDKDWIVMELRPTR